MSLVNILLEGKKENLIDKYKNDITIDGFESLLGDFIEKDPSPTKKYSEWMVKELIRLWKSPSYNANSLVDLMKFMSDEIKTFHELSNSITDNDIEYFLKQIDGANSRGIKYFESPSKQDRVKRSPKDIYSYPSIWTIQMMNKSINDRKKIQQEEEEAKKDVEKIYEDNRFLIIQPFSHKASCYYGQNTKWCTTSKNDDSYFKRYTKEGRLYYIIDKSATGHSTLGKMALHIDNDGSASAWDQQDNNRGIDFMLDRFEPISDLLKKLIQGDDDYQKLKKVKNDTRSSKSQKLSAPYFESMDSEYVYLSFSDVEDYLNLFSEEVDEYELKNVEYALEQPYGYEGNYYDTYQFGDDMSEGYPMYMFNQSHLKKLRQVFKIMGSELINCFSVTAPAMDKESLKKYIQKSNDEKDFYDLYNLKITNCEEKIGKYLLNFDSDFIDSFEYAYSTAEDESMAKGVSNALNEELCNIYSDIGFIKEENSTCFTEYKISTDKLIEMYEDNLEYYSGYTLDQLLKSYVESKVTFVRDPREMAYEERDDETFRYHFDDDMDTALDNLIEKLENNVDYKDLDEFKTIYSYIENNYGFNVPIPVETTDGDVFLELKQVHPEDNKISFELLRRGNNYGFKKGRAKLKTIQQLLTNYQLFDPFED